MDALKFRTVLDEINCVEIQRLDRTAAATTNKRALQNAKRRFLLSRCLALQERETESFVKQFVL